MSLRKKGRQQLHQKISVHWTQKICAKYTRICLPRPLLVENNPDSPPHSTYCRRRHRTHCRRRGGSSSQVSCVYATSTYTSLSQSPTYLSPQHPNHNRRRRNPNLYRYRGPGPSTTFLPLRRRFGYTPPPIPLSRLHFSPHAPLFLPEPNPNQVCRSQFASWPQHRWWQQKVNVGTHLQVCGILQLSLLQ
jgi:hypothetical protein